MFNKTASTPTTTGAPTTGAPITSNPMPTPDTSARPAGPSYPTQSDAAQPRRPSATSRTPSLLGSDIVFEGTITGEGELHVEGDIVHEQLSIDVGAYFTGRCQVMKKPAPQPVATPALAAPAKVEEPAAAAKPANGAASKPPEKNPSAAAAN